MISDKQKKILKRVITYSDLVKCYVIGLFMTVVLWMLLMMVDDLILGNPGVFISGIVILMVVLVIYCILLLIQGIYVRVVVTKEDWLDMTEKAKEILADIEEDDKAESIPVAVRVGLAALGLLTPVSAVDIARIGSMPVLMRKMKEKRDAGTAMAALFDVDLRSRSVAKAAVVLIPIIALMVAFGIRCADAAQIKESAYTAAGSAVDALVVSFSEGCEAVIGDDPYDGYDENGYSWACYLDETWTNYVRVEIDNSGLITSVDYFVSVDVGLTKEENLTMVEEMISQMYAMVIGSGVEAEDDTVLSEPILTDSFKESFIAASYYENIAERTETYALYYFTDDEDNYQDSYLRISMG